MRKTQYLGTNGIIGATIRRRAKLCKFIKILLVSLHRLVAREQKSPSPRE